MNTPGESRRIDASLVSILERLPVLSYYAKTRGWHYVISWLHRFTGVSLMIVLMIYAYSSSSLPGVNVSNASNAEMKVILSPIFLFLAWISSLPMSFHALNGGRLILYELFGRRNDEEMIHWIFGLTAAYAVMIGLMMVMKNQHASAFFFWLMAAFSGAVAAYIVASRIRGKRHSVLWKLQRISGAFLFITAPAYLLFWCLNPGQINGIQEVAAGAQNFFVRLVALAAITGALSHAGYGLFSIGSDYTSSRITRAGMTALVIAIIAVLAVLVFRLILVV